MLFDDMLKHPVVKQMIATGEEQATKVVGKLLSDQRVTQGLQELLAAAAAARATVESGVQAALHAANLPTAEELRTMRQKLSELEAQVEALNSRLPSDEASTPVKAAAPEMAAPQEKAAPQESSEP
jgi:polyhydroxyalkanoate synthesis regulator phasin